MAKILDISFAEYHELERFSSSAAKAVIARSPAHARAEIEKKATKEMDFGSVAHRLILGKGTDFQVLNHDSYRKDIAKTERDNARAAGKVPILVEAFERANVVAESVRVQLADRGLHLDGQSEVAVTWDEETHFGPVPCKAMFDHVWLDRGVILDLKITENAAPDAVERTAENLGYAIQYAAYVRALTELDKRWVGRAQFLFAFCESHEPYAMNLMRPDGAFTELGERRWMRAVTTWGECLKKQQWPAYGAGVNNLTAPTWALTKEDYAA